MFPLFPTTRPGMLATFAASIAATLAAAILWSSARAENDPGKNAYEHLELFAEVLTRVKAEHVEDLAYEDMIEAAISGMLVSLDPHSAYLNPSALDNMQIQAAGQYGGIGVEVISQNGRIKVVSPIDDTPASRAGLMPEDYITAVDGQNIAGMEFDAAIRKMRGPAGKDIVLTILRRDVEPFTVTLTREIIKQKSASGRLIDNIAYARLSTFNEQTGKALEKLLGDLKKQAKGKPQGLILDLRNNPGGLLDQAVLTAGLFLDGGEVVSTRGRREDDANRYNAKRGQLYAGIPMVVLVNSGSASAAEIVAGALQDRQRATIVGTDSFGKGSVQTIIPLGAQRGALRLTVSRYYTPSGRSIQGAGIEPDIEIAARRLTETELKRIQDLGGPRLESSLRNSLGNDQGRTRRPPHVPNDQPPQDYDGEDYQLDRALDIITAGQASVGRAG